MMTKEAKSIAKALTENIILKYGIFSILKSDKGTEFTNDLMKEICTLLKIEQKFSTPYHHETLGTVERNHRVLNEYFLSYVDEENWHSWIPYYAFAYNTTPHVDTEYSPFELLYGRLPKLPSDEIMRHDKVYNYENYANELKVRLKYSLDRAREMLVSIKIKRQQKFREKEQPINLKIGDLVLVKLENRKKNIAPYHGPYKVIAIKDPNVIIEVNSKEKLIHKNNLKIYHAQ